MFSREKRPNKKSGRALLKVLASQYDALVAAGSDASLLNDYAALVRYLRFSSKSETAKIFSDAARPIPRPAVASPEYSDNDLRNRSLEEVEKIVNQETTPRKYLERIAIHRFDVPKGSMRSFSNRRLLVEKLLTLISNERTHVTIDLVARGRSAKNDHG